MPRKKHRISVSDVIGEEWKTPNSYAKEFAPLGDFSAVYMLVVHEDWRSGMGFQIAYVGMSARLSKRFHSHSALDHIRSTKKYCQIWFKPIDKSHLREEERRLIREYDPPLNLIGKVVSLS
jgi:hypothetical protein